MARLYHTETDLCLCLFGMLAFFIGDGRLGHVVSLRYVVHQTPLPVVAFVMVASRLDFPDGIARRASRPDIPRVAGQGVSGMSFSVRRWAVSRERLELSCALTADCDC